MNDPYFSVPRDIYSPSSKIPMLDWWRGVYAHVYVALHPFYRIKNSAIKSSCGAPEDYEPCREYDGSCEEVDEGRWWHWLDEMREKSKHSAEFVDWNEIHSMVAPGYPKKEVYRSIWLLSCCGFHERANEKIQRQIDDYCFRNSIFLPDVDGMPAALEPRIGQFLEKLGLKQATAWDEFRDNSTVLNISDFRKNKPSRRLPKATTLDRVWAIHASNPGMLMTWAFDSSEMLIAMTDEARMLADPSTFFEGWYAKEGDYSDVFNPASFMERYV